MELKHLNHNNGKFKTLSINRTFMELKQDSTNGNSNGNEY